VLTRLGQPEATGHVQEYNTWTYTSRGLSIVWDTDSTVLLVLILSPRAGSIEGVSVGDAPSAVRARLGLPTDSSAESEFYARGSWTLVVHYQNFVVDALGIRRAG
jgi:hypothetical protein